MRKTPSMKIHVDKEAPEGAWTVCAAEGHFADDVRATCHQCGTGIVHRPDAAPGPKICVPCFDQLMREHGNDVRVGVTEKTIEEARLFVTAQVLDEAARFSSDEENSA